VAPLASLPRAGVKASTAKAPRQLLQIQDIRIDEPSLPASRYILNEALELFDQQPKRPRAAWSGKGDLGGPQGVGSAECLCGERITAMGAQARSPPPKGCVCSVAVMVARPVRCKSAR